MNQVDHGIRSDPLPKASARPRLHPRYERSEAAKSLRTSLARRIELVATGWLVWHEGESSLYSEDDFFTAPPGLQKVVKPAAITAADAINN